VSSCSSNDFATANASRSGLFIGPPTVYNIAQGETVSKVAELVMGDPAAWRAIAVANNIDNPRKLLSLAFATASRGAFLRRKRLAFSAHARVTVDSHLMLPIDFAFRTCHLHTITPYKRGSTVVCVCFD
jgi:hypothetical protein